MKRCKAVTRAGNKCPYGALLDGLCNVHFVQKMRKEGNISWPESIRR
jgi:hypothetical protein